jgi:predicted O-methyltransferase YrrM
MSVLRSYGRSGQQLHFIRGDSHEDGTRSRLLETLQGRQLDLLMIDGDHTYEGVKRDFEMYSPLVRQGCPIAFHDILSHPEDQACEVDRFWEETKDAYRHMEFVDPHRDRQGRQYGGLGILFQAEDPAH